MSEAAEILKSVQVGLDVAIFLFNTERGLQATELCNECVILLQNLDSGVHLDILIEIFNAYCSISDNTDARKYAFKLFDTASHAGILTLKLGDKCAAKRRFFEAKQLFKGTLTITKTFGPKIAQALVHERLGSVFTSLYEIKKAIKHLEKALAIAIEIGDRKVEGRTYGKLGALFHSLGEYRKAKEYLEKALAITIEIGDREKEGIAYTKLGFVSKSLGKYQKAKEYLEKALAIAIEITDRQSEGLICRKLGEVFNSVHEYQKAKEYLEKALAIAIEIGDRILEEATYGNLGYVFHSFGEYQKAKEYREKALVIALEIGDREKEGRAYANLGAVFNSLGEYQKAKEHLEKALAIVIEIGDRQGEGRVYGELGKVFNSVHKYQKAKEYYEKALTTAIESGDRKGEAAGYESLGDLFGSLSEYQKAKEYNQKALAIAIEIGDRKEEAARHGNLGDLFGSLGEYQKAEEYHEKALAIAIEIGHRKLEGTTYGNLGIVFFYLGEYQKAKEYSQKSLAIAKELGDRKGEGRIYGNLRAVFNSLGEYPKVQEYNQKALPIAIEVGDRKLQRITYQSFGEVFNFLGEHSKAKEYMERALAIAIEIGDREVEGLVYFNLGSIYRTLRKSWHAKEHFEKAVSVSIAIGHRGLEAIATAELADVSASVNDRQKAKEHCEKALIISRECYNRELEANLYLTLGKVFQWLGKYSEAANYIKKACSISSQIGHKKIEFESLVSITQLKIVQSEAVEAKEYLFQCLRKYEQMRTSLKGNSEFEISLLERQGTLPYQLLSKLLCNAAKYRDALYVEELGRARVLAETMADKYSTESLISADPQSWFGIENIIKRENNCVFLYISYVERQVYLWVLKANGDIFFRATGEVKVKTLIDENVCDVEGVFKKSAAYFGVLPANKCEDRSLGDSVTTSVHEKSRTNLRGDEIKNIGRTHHLCYKWIIAPVADLLTEPEIIIVPDRFSYRVPFAALRDEAAAKYLSEKYRIRIVPSLTTLRHIQECPSDYHSQSDALVVGNPTVGKVSYNGRVVDVTPLSCANKEAEMVGRLLDVQPLTERGATKQAVLQAIPLVSLIHFAAHGNAERGEIALSPQSTTNSTQCCTNITPKEEDYLLTMSDIQRVQVRAKLVVLSCCHSGRGLVKKEGVIGIARAFLASGARSVLVASWAIEDEATAKLMEYFYKHLVRGESACESLHQAVQWLRSNGFPKPSQWAPFVLMGDNVTFEFLKKGKEELSEDNKGAEEE